VIDRFQQIRILEAMLFSASAPLQERVIVARMPEGVDVQALLAELQALYANRGVHLRRVGQGWAFRTAPDLGPYLRIETEVQRRLSRAALETLAIIAYHQPITRAEIEEMRGVSLSRGTLDMLLEVGWIRPRGRRRSAGRPTTWGTTEEFLDHFGIETMDDLPGLEELKAAGLLDRRPGFGPLSEIREQASEEKPLDEDVVEIGEHPRSGEDSGDIEVKSRRSQTEQTVSGQSDEEPAAEDREVLAFSGGRPSGTG
jgi:segregation and condensation protein B